LTASREPGGGLLKKESLMAEIDTATRVRVLLEAAGVTPTEKEFEAYPVLRAQTDALYIEEIRYEEPALVFTPISPTK
jgi:hypothetical protein